MKETTGWTRRAALLAGAAVLLASAGCGKRVAGLGRVVGPIPVDSVALNLVLIGDAGLPNPAGEPVLRALQREIAAAPEKSFVVFLGDNLYPVGLSDTLTEAGREGLRILRAQMQPLRDTQTRGLFVPGNHDWGQGAPEGWEHVVRQERFINTEGAGRIGMEPRDGCPGPVVVDVGLLVRVIAIDTHWWLHPSTKPGPDRCRPGTEQGVVDSLRVALATAGDRRTVVVAHHPIVSGGQHGGYFDWPTYLFPFHPWARQAGLFARQDVTGREYRHMTTELTRAFVVDTPTVFAAGHEHNLQVFRRDPAKYLLVSGGGIYGHITPTRRITGIRYIRDASGYQRITFLDDGRARLSVMVVDAEGNATEDYSMWLDVPPLSGSGTGAPPGSSGTGTGTTTGAAPAAAGGVR